MEFNQWKTNETLTKDKAESKIMHYKLRNTHDKIGTKNI